VVVPWGYIRVLVFREIVMAEVGGDLAVTVGTEGEGLVVVVVVVPLCIGCNKVPDQLGEYHPDAVGLVLVPYEYVWQEEGTLNPSNGHFLCDSCYIAAGMPTAPGGWTAP